ncbi:hypothetical protein EES47_07530 [Streptomyces sp. ADI98-12]|nr:hypothetical protein EES47_07530 [Streptomyces sp. ADI98-12]
MTGGVLQRRPRRARPDRRDQRDREVLHEVRRERVPVQELPEGRPAPAAVGEQRPRPAVEGRHGGQHPHEPQVGHVLRLGEQPARPERPRVLQTAALAPYRHAHLRLLGLDTQFAEEPQQVRVGPLVVHDEPGVDRPHHPVRPGQLMGVRVSPEPLVGLVHGDVLRLPQHVRRRQPGDSGPHHRHPPPLPPHAALPFTREHRRTGARPAPLIPLFGAGGRSGLEAWALFSGRRPPGPGGHAPAATPRPVRRELPCRDRDSLPVTGGGDRDARSPGPARRSVRPRSGGSSPAQRHRSGPRTGRAPYPAAHDHPRT